ncbi:PREDICTED: peroxidase 15-like, partial [Populus euphratica]|uniref:peroxidase n=1 Tax=Populus euphratica TaxID=75702 RepID=A0AAJ6U9Q6_POPEU
TTVAAQQSVALFEGPSWESFLGRKDGLTASQTGANKALPSPFDPLIATASKFAAVGLDSRDLVALSGAHSFGRVRCLFLTPRLYDFNNTRKPDPTFEQNTTEDTRGGNGTVLTNLNPTTVNTFDNRYFSNLQTSAGLLQSDQELFSTPKSNTVELVNQFSANQTAFIESFVASMIKISYISVLTGMEGEVRTRCLRVNNI